MGRFTLDEKLTAVQDYLIGNTSYMDIANQMKVDKKSVRKWVTYYKYHGIDGLKPHSYCKSFTKMFKLEVIEYLERTGASYFEVAARFNIRSQSSIPKWRRELRPYIVGTAQFDQKESSPMPKKNKIQEIDEIKEIDDIKQMKKELEYLRMENAYLKKLRALVQKEKKSPLNKRRK